MAIRMGVLRHILLVGVWFAVVSSLPYPSPEEHYSNELNVDSLGNKLVGHPPNDRRELVVGTTEPPTQRRRPIIGRDPRLSTDEDPSSANVRTRPPINHRYMEEDRSEEMLHTRARGYTQPSPLSTVTPHTPFERKNGESSMEGLRSERRETARRTEFATKSTKLSSHTTINMTKWSKSTKQQTRIISGRITFVTEKPVEHTPLTTFLSSSSVTPTPNEVTPNTEPIEQSGTPRTTIKTTEPFEPVEDIPLTTPKSTEPIGPSGILLTTSKITEPIGPAYIPLTTPKTTEPIGPEDIPLTTPKITEPIGPEDIPLTTPKTTEPIGPADIPLTTPKITEPIGPADIPLTTPKTTEPIGPEDIPLTTPKTTEPIGPADIPLTTPKTTEPIGPADIPLTTPKTTEPIGPDDVPLTTPKTTEPIGPADIPLTTPKTTEPIGPDDIPSTTIKITELTEPVSSPLTTHKEPTPITVRPTTLSIAPISTASTLRFTSSTPHPASVKSPSTTSTLAKSSTSSAAQSSKHSSKDTTGTPSTKQTSPDISAASVASTPDRRTIPKISTNYTSSKITKTVLITTPLPSQNTSLRPASSSSTHKSVPTRPSLSSTLQPVSSKTSPKTVPGLPFNSTSSTRTTLFTKASSKQPNNTASATLPNLSTRGLPSVVTDWYTKPTKPTFETTPGKTNTNKKAIVTGPITKPTKHIPTGTTTPKSSPTPKTSTQFSSTQTQRPMPPTLPQNPEIFITMELEMSLEEFCVVLPGFKGRLCSLINDIPEVDVENMDVQIDKAQHCAGADNLRETREKTIETIEIKVFIVDKAGNVNGEVTLKIFQRINSTGLANGLNTKIRTISIIGVKEPSLNQNEHSDPSKQLYIIVGVVLSVCVVSLGGIGLVIVRRRATTRRGQPMRPSFRRNYPEDDTYSMSSFVRTPKKKHLQSFRSLHAYNVAYQHDEHSYSNAMTLSKLSTRSLEMDFLEEELKSIPSNMPKLSTLPDGAHAKNRYANVIPLEESRVVLQSKPQGRCSQYINANYVKGYMGVPKAYIATQAPLDSTAVDFWTMVWENQSQVIIMLMQFTEDGQRKCSQYIPESDGIDSIAVFGRYEVFLKKQIFREGYIFSCLVLKDMEKNLCKDIVHFQYLDFPARYAPSSVYKMLNFIREVKPYMEVSHGPTVVHCSTGTGRTGTLLAIDLCVQAYDDSRTIDIMNCVYKLRTDRAGAVHAVAHYAFIYKVMLEYANQTSTSNTPSQWSSRTTLAEN